MTKTKFGVVGIGNIGVRHIHHIMANCNAELVAVCDIDANKKDEYGVHFYNDLGAMLDAEAIDVLNVCTPNYLHASHSILALNEGLHVVCEKPMAINSADCSQMIAAAEANGKHIFVVKQNRYNPPVQVVKKLLQTGRLGKVLMIQVSCFWNRNESYYGQSAWRGTKAGDGGCLYTQFSHFVDILFYLFGKCEAVSSCMHNYLHSYTEIEDAGVCTLLTKDGALVNFAFSTCAYDKNMEGAISVIAEYGTVKIGGQYLNTIEYQNIKGEQLPSINITAKNNEYGLYQGSMSNHDLVIENVINTLAGKDTVMTNAQEGKQVVEMIEAMYARNLE
jgi:UDP-N-acetyl-2-amino-2-deoxyglucuronate dehydrogenase